MEPKNVTVNLPIEAWNVVLNALGQRPFVEVKSLIEEITNQAQGQINQPTATEE